MAVWEHRLDTFYEGFQKSRMDVQQLVGSECCEAAYKRILYYLQSRLWMEHVFEVKRESGLNLRKLLVSEQEFLILSERPDPTQKVYAGGRQQFHYVFCAVSPVLQQLISLRLWPEQVPKARDLVVGLRKTLREGKVPFVGISGGTSLTWPHTSLRILHGAAVISKTHVPDKALDLVMRIPGLHSSARELTWWRGLSEYSSQYIAADEDLRFLTGGVCLAKLDQRMSGHCQMRVLNDDGHWSGLLRFQYSGYRAKDILERPGSVYSIVYMREFDAKADHDHLWLHDVVQASPLSILLHLVMRKLHGAYLASGRLQLLEIKDLEILNGQLLNMARMIFSTGKSGGAGLIIPLSILVHMLLEGFYREIDGRLYFVPPGMSGESSDKLKDLDRHLESLQGKDKEGRNFFRQFLGEDDALKSVVLTWLMARINSGLRPWIPHEIGTLSAWACSESKGG